MKTARFIPALLIGVTALLAVPCASFAADNAVVKAMEEYFDFSEYGGDTVAAGYLRRTGAWRN